MKQLAVSDFLEGTPSPRNKLALARALLDEHRELLQELKLHLGFKDAVIYRRLIELGVFTPEQIPLRTFRAALKKITAPAVPAKSSSSAPHPAQAAASSAVPGMKSPRQAAGPQGPLAQRLSAPVCAPEDLVVFQPGDPRYPFAHFIAGAFAYDPRSGIVYGLRCLSPPDDPRPWPILGGLEPERNPSNHGERFRNAEQRMLWPQDLEGYCNTYYHDLGRAVPEERFVHVRD